MNNYSLISVLLCFLVFSFKAKGQEDFNDEVVFVVFDNSEFQKHEKRLNDDYIYGKYFFAVSEKPNDSSDNVYERGVITLVDKKYKDFDQKGLDNPSPRFKVHKSFLRKNQKQIISIKKMRELGSNKIFKLLFNAKHVFLIDKTERSDNKVIVKEVFLTYLANE